MVIAKLEKIKFDLDWVNSSGHIGSCQYSENENSYVCIKEEQIIGACVVSKTREIIFARGTLVRPTWRKQGIARDLWLAMLKSENPKEVRVDLVSDKGLTLINTVKKQFPSIDWKITSSAERTLRNLKGK